MVQGDYGSGGETDDGSEDETHGVFDCHDSDMREWRMRYGFTDGSEQWRDDYENHFEYNSRNQPENPEETPIAHWK